MQDEITCPISKLQQCTQFTNLNFQQNICKSPYLTLNAMFWMKSIRYMTPTQYSVFPRGLWLGSKTINSSQEIISTIKTDSKYTENKYIQTWRNSKCNKTLGNIPAEPLQQAIYWNGPSRPATHYITSQTTAPGASTANVMKYSNSPNKILCRKSSLKVIGRKWPQESVYIATCQGQVTLMVGWAMWKNSFSLYLSGMISIETIIMMTVLS